MRFGMCILAGVALAACGGCAALGGAANPRTEVSASPLGGFRFHDSKDNDIEIENAEYDPSTKALKIGKLTIRNNATDVRIASVQQMDAFNRQLVTHGENITRFGQIVLGLAETIAPLALPGVKLDGPLGGSATVNAATSKALIDALAPAIEKLVNDAIAKAAREGKFRETAPPDPAEGAPEPSL